MLRSHLFLLVEDNEDDVELTLRAFKKSNVLNQIEVVGDGQAALDYMFSTGAYAGRDSTLMPGARATRSEAAENRPSRGAAAHAFR